MRIAAVKMSLADYNALVAERDALRDERDELLIERAEAVEVHSRIMAEKCPPDEQHCTCVPALRAEIERLKAALRSWVDDYDHDIFILAKNGNENSGIDEGELLGSMALAETIRLTRVALEVKK